MANVKVGTKVAKNASKPVVMTANGAVFASQVISGPIPSAEEMEGYARIDKTLPGRIMDLTEKQSEHRQKMEMAFLESQIQQQKLGTICAFLLGVLGIASGTICAIWAPWYTGIASWAITIGAILWAFLRGTKSNREERERKWKDVKSSPAEP